MTNIADFLLELEKDNIDLLNNTHLMQKFTSDEEKKLSNRIRISSHLKSFELKNTSLNDYMLSILMHDLPYNKYLDA